MLKARDGISAGHQELDADPVASMIRLKEQAFAKVRLLVKGVRSSGALAKVRVLNQCTVLRVLSAGFAMTGKRSFASAASSSVALSIAATRHGYADRGRRCQRDGLVQDAPDDVWRRRADRAERESSSYAAATICSDESLRRHYPGRARRTWRSSTASRPPRRRRPRAARPRDAREKTPSAWPLGTATMHRAPWRCSDRAMVTTVRGSAPTMMTVRTPTIALGVDSRLTTPGQIPQRLAAERMCFS